MRDAPIIIVLVGPWPDRHLREGTLPLRRLVDDLRDEGIPLLPFPLPPYPDFLPDELWREWEYWFRRYDYFDFDEWKYLLQRWYRHARGRDEHWTRSQYFLEVHRFLRWFSRHDRFYGIVFVAPISEAMADIDEYLYDLAREFESIIVVWINIDTDDRYRVHRIPGVRSLDYPEDRSELLKILRRFPRERDLPLSAPSPPATAEPSAPEDAAPPPPAAAEPSAPEGAAPPPPAAAAPSAPEEAAPPPPAAAEPSAPEEAAPPPPAAAEPSARADVIPEEVHLGASAPRAVSPGETFVARFAAYTDANRKEVARVLKVEAPTSQQRLDLDKCRWHPDTKVMVRLAVDGANVSQPVQSFKWNGTCKILRFDVKVLDEFSANTLILRFDVAVEGLPITALRPEVEVIRGPQDEMRASQSSFVEQAAPTSAFASYAGTDRRDVLGRVRSLQIFTGIDVFLDCLSLRPGDEWKPKLRNEIRNRDIFWLFWSRNAMQSQWVDWEWRTALGSKSLAGIQPHPLEPLELAPPPEELSDLQFGAMYEWYVSQLRESWLTHKIRAGWHRGASLIRKLWIRKRRQ